MIKRLTRSILFRITTIFSLLLIFVVPSSANTDGLIGYWSFDTIEVDVQCPPDTIRVFKEVPMVQIVPEKKERNIALGGVIGFILALVLIRVAGRFIK